MKIYKCSHCGNVITKITDSGVPVMCCGKPMDELAANTVDASLEKHVPVVEAEGNKVKVKVGAVEHPMAAEHFIEWIYLETAKGGQLKKLFPGETPEVVFALEDDRALAVYAYCNLHGLWKAEVVEKVACETGAASTGSKENYKVCNCNNVSYFDILDEVEKHGDLNELLDVFEEVKNTTHCSTGCGGCYDKVIGIISDAMAGMK